MRSRSPSNVFRIVAGLTAVSLGVAAASRADGPPSGVPASPEVNPPGQVMAHGLGRPQPGAGDAGPITPSTPDMKAVQDLLGHAADAATTPGHTTDVLSLLARHDRDRMGTPADWSDVDRAADAFRSAWRARFGTSFKLADKIAIVFTEPAVHVTGMDPPPAAPSTQPTTTRKSAVTVILSEPGRRSSVAIRLANEGTDQVEWHIDLPDTTSAAALHDGLLRHLTVVTAAQAQWPTDVDQAYVYVTGHVLSAFGDAAAPR